MEAILYSQEAHLRKEAEGAMIERRLRLLRALIESRTILGRGDKERLRLLTHELESLPPDDEVSWNVLPLSFAFWLALLLQQPGALLVEKLCEARQWISKAGDPLATFRVMTWLATAFRNCVGIATTIRGTLKGSTEKVRDCKAWREPVRLQQGGSPLDTDTGSIHHEGVSACTRSAQGPRN
jgi:hypothetical protein